MKKRIAYIAAVSATLLLFTACQNDPAPVSSDVSEPEPSVSTSVSEQAGESTTAQGTSAIGSSATSAAKSESGTEKSEETTKKVRKTVATTAHQAQNGNFVVTPQYTIQEAAKKFTNANVKLNSVTKVASVRSRIADVDKAYSYTHHPGLAVFKGKLYASYSNGYKVEDTPGQRVVVSSIDLNKFGSGSWSTPKVIGAPGKSAFAGAGGVPDDAEKFCLNSFLYTDGNKLYAVYMERDYGPDSYYNGAYVYDKQSQSFDGKHYHPQPTVSSKVMMTYTTDGVNWSTPTEFGYAANETPRQSLTGQWFAGSGDRLLYSSKESPAISATAWKLVGMTDTQTRNSNARQSNSAGALTESSWYQTEDKIIHQVFRSGDSCLFLAESYDNGKTWTEAYPTNFRQDTSMAKFGALPDGRYYYIGNANYNAPGQRNPLYIFLSEDGYNFDKAYILRDEKYTVQADVNWTKVGAHSYPEALVEGDYLYVVYSEMREVMEVTRVKLSDIK